MRTTTTAFFLALVVLTAHASRAAEPNLVIATLRVNGIENGNAVIVQQGTDILVRNSDVSSIPFPRHPTVTTIDGDSYDSLKSSGIEFAYNPATLTLNLTYRISTHTRIILPTPLPPFYHNGSSATIAYNATIERRGFPAISALATYAFPGAQIHLGFSRAGNIFYRTDLSGQILEHGQNGEILLGDQTLTTSGALPSFPIFGLGITQGKELRTSALRAPFERISGTLTHPTTVEIAIANKQPIDADIQPGPFTIDGIPLAAQISATDDITGLPVKVIVGPPLNGNLLAPGWHEITASAGIPRTCIYACSQYHGFAAGGSLLIGDSQFFASGPHAEIFNGEGGVGYDLIASDSTHAFQLSAGIGPLDGILASYNQRLGKFSYSLGYGINGAPTYNENGKLVAAGRNISTSLGINYGNTGFSYESQNYSTTGNIRTLQVTQNVHVFHTSVQLDLMDRLSRTQSTQISLGIMFPIALNRFHDTTLVGTTIGAHQGTASTISSQINTPSGFDIGANGIGNFTASYTSDMIALSGTSNGVLTLSGAFAFLHGVHLVRDPTNGYVIATGQPGDLLHDTNGQYHTIRANHATAFPIAPEDTETGLSYLQRTVTLNSTTTVSPTSVYPAPGAGTLVTITHKRLFSVIGKIVAAKYFFGTITLDNGAASPIGSDGVFYFEGLASGHYTATISTPDVSCHTLLVVPTSTAQQIDIGTIACAIVKSP